ncbi:MAG: beta strand repeat-containing protein [Ilumatobacteraceae bacterium]
MTALPHPRIGQSKPRALRRTLISATLVVSSVAVFSGAPASATPLNYRVDLKVLVLDDSSGPVAALKSQMQAEGVKYSTINLTSGTDFNAATLASATEAFYQAVVLPSSQPANLSTAENNALRAFEAKFGIRQVDAWDNNVLVYNTIGLNAPTYDGILDGATAVVNPAGKAAGFGYLNGPVPFSVGSFGHIAAPLSNAYTSLVDSTPPGGGTSGSIVGVYSNGGVEQMVITPGFDFTFLQFKYLGHGIISWMTRGVHFGYYRNDFTFHFDDAFGEDSLWDSTRNCTPNEDCLADGTTLPAARMSAADVTAAVNWMQLNNYKITLPFNGSYAITDGSDALTNALLANKTKFNWLNHGFAHVYQGCVQNTTVSPWVCTLNAGQPVFNSLTTILNEINNNIQLANTTLGLSGLYDPKEYLSGEHSGLAFTNAAVPGQNQPDNPNFITAMNQTAMVAIGSDASRETGSRPIGTGTITIPRHPTALFYNTATRAQAIDEYNWFYAPAPDGQCTANCITKLTVDSDFDQFIVPRDAAFDLGFILSNDPRPFYAHVTNLVGGASALAYPLLESILGTYRNAFAPSAPVMNLTLTQAATQLSRQQQWTTDSALVSGYVQNGAISITNTTGHVVPFTAPTGSTVVGNTFESYGGESSAWLAAGSPTGTLPAATLVTTPNGTIGTSFLVGQAGTMSLTVASTPTATVVATGALPAGLIYTPIQGGVTISGTPAVNTYGTYPITVNVMTAGYNNLETVNLYVARVATFSSAATATAVAGNPFTFTVTTASGVPNPAITLKSGTLPAGITLTDLGTGSATLSGTPALATGGQSFPVTFTATTPAGATDQAFTLVVNSIPAITSATSAAAVVGAPFSFTVTTSGTPVPAITKTGTLPSGMAFTDLGNGTAQFSGTAVVADVGKSFPVTLTATSSAGVAHQSFTLSVTRVPQFTSAASATALSGNAFNFSVSAVGAPMPAITMSGALPTGVTFTSSGNGQASLSGTPEKAAAGHSFPVTFTAVNSFGTTNQSFTLTVTADKSLVSVTPARLADTRPGFATVDTLFAGGGIRATGSTLELTVAGRGGVPADAAAVALNVTVAEPVGSGFVTVYPCGAQRPNASNLDYTAGAVVPNAVIAQIGTNGSVCLFVSNSAQLIVDVNGFFPHNSTFSSMNPARILDTRSGYTTIDGLQQGEGIRGRNQITRLHVADRVGVPADAAAVVLNVTVTEAAGFGFVTVYPCGPTIPTASNINYAAGSTVANLVIAKVGPGGDVCLYNNEATHLIVDVNGYFPNDGSYQAIDPARLLETRPGMKTVDEKFMSTGMLPNGTVTKLMVANRGGVPAAGKTVVLNVTVTDTAVPGFITAYPCGPDIPNASNLDYGVNTTVAIAVIVKVSSAGEVCLFNSGSTQLIADVNGYLTN